MKRRMIVQYPCLAKIEHRLCAARHDSSDSHRADSPFSPAFLCRRMRQNLWVFVCVFLLFTPEMGPTALSQVIIRDPIAKGTKLQGPKGCILELKFSASGKFLASTDYQSNVVVWELKSNAITRRMKPRQGRFISSIEFSRDEKHLFVGEAEGMIAYDVIGNRQTSYTFKDGVVALSASPDGKFLAIGVGKDIELWDVKKKKTTRTLKGHPWYISTLAWSTDSKKIASSDFG